MTVERKQCLAITKKGTHCKLYAQPNNELCHVHVKMKNKNKELDKAKGNNRNMPDKQPSKLKSNANTLKTKICCNSIEPGNIYVFTYAHMMNPKPTKTPYLKTAAPTKNNRIDYNNTTPFDTTDEILLKIGFTRKTPEVRVEEWRQQCGHSDFILIYPGCLVPTYKKDLDKSVKKLSFLLEKLKIGGKKEQSRANCSTGKKYANLNREKTCFVSTNPYQTEQQIHRVLREKYGTGKMYCDGCSRHKINGGTENFMTKISGVHTEWFLIPRTEMHLVWETIEYFCKL